MRHGDGNHQESFFILSDSGSMMLSSNTLHFDEWNVLHGSIQYRSGTAFGGLGPLLGTKSGQILTLAIHQSEPALK